MARRRVPAGTRSPTTLTLMKPTGVPKTRTSTRTSANPARSRSGSTGLPISTSTHFIFRKFIFKTSIAERNRVSETCFSRFASDEGRHGAVVTWAKNLRNSRGSSGVRVSRNDVKLLAAFGFRKARVDRKSRRMPVIRKPLRTKNKRTPNSPQLILRKEYL